MAKRKQVKGNKKRGGRAKQQLPRAVGRPAGPGLDRQAVEYARLLADPCNAPLAHPLYVGADGGIVARFETDLVVFVSGTTTAAAFVWTPGGIGTTGTVASNLSQFESPLSSSGATAAGLVPATNPGFNFLSANASAARCVAACLQVYWPGSEQNRAGYITYGKCPGSSVIIGTAGYTADGVGTIFQTSQRMPVDRIDVVWKPMDGDQQWTNPSANTPTIELTRKGAVGFVVKGIPSGTGVRVRMVAVYEYMPIAASGLSIPYDSRNMSNNTLDQVVNFLDRIGGFTDGAVKFGASALRAAGKVGRAVNAVSYASRAMPALLM